MRRNHLAWFLTQVVIMVLVLAIPAIAVSAEREWPNKAITVIVGTPPGGNADSSTRVITAEMSKILGVPIVVVNMPGGGGGIAADKVFREPNDGYTWHCQGTAVRTLAVMGFHAKPPHDWYCIPTTTYAALISVRADSPYKNFADLIAALKKEPGKIPYGASNPATAYRITMEQIKAVTGIHGRYIPYGGTTETQAALLSADVQYIMSGVGEQAELLRGKKYRALAVYEDKPYYLKGYGEIPPITDQLPQMRPYFPFLGWISFTIRADTPKPILNKIDGAFIKAVQTKAVKDYLESYDVTLVGPVGEEAQKLFLKQASRDSWLLYELGVAKKSPADFNILKP